MHTLPSSPTAPLSPMQIACTFDCLARFPVADRLAPSLLTSIVCAIGRDEIEATALLVRVRATAIVFADRRWPSWAAYFSGCQGEARMAFDAVLMRLIASAPLDARLRFDADTFFSSLLERVVAAGRG